MASMQMASRSRKRTNSGCTTTTFCALDDMEGSKGETVMVWDASILQALGGSDACWLRLVFEPRAQVRLHLFETVCGNLFYFLVDVKHRLFKFVWLAETDCNLKPSWFLLM
ncbi:unnamed protein product [Durusdinium trenchii]|uniref:Uncharacterized protein n=1 Tax=Durusdinium trenchii TaxID=1381693 RepID=A0ABP0HZN2_9DINO